MGPARVAALENNPAEIAGCVDHEREVAQTILRITWDDHWQGHMGNLQRRAVVKPGIYRGRGVVERLEEATSRIVITHEDIPGFMPAMTMPFEVADSSLLAGLSPGESVSFRVASSDGGGSDAVRRGAEHYADYCASCHGLQGDGPVASTLATKPAPHSNRAHMDGLSDADLFRVIKQGRPAVGKSPQMAAWGGLLSDEAIGDLVAYVRTLAH